MIRLPYFGDLYGAALATFSGIAFAIVAGLTARWWLDPLIRRSQRPKPPIVARYVRKPRYSELKRGRAS
jgi:hypothetical protein